MSVKEAEFWRSTEEYHDLAEYYETHIELEHPPVTTACCRFCYHCIWHPTCVKYHTYTGESLRNLNL